MLRVDGFVSAKLLFSSKSLVALMAVVQVSILVVSVARSRLSILFCLPENSGDCRKVGFL